MRSGLDTKKWGTIYLGGNKEATLESIDAMQAAARQEQWNQRTQNEYLDRVRERATDRAREILGAAHTERQNILTEARTEAERIRLETQVQYDKADKALTDAEAIRAEAQAIREDAEAIRNAAQEEGFTTGLANARDELDAFRGAMGASIAVVLQSIERQNAAIFSAWREEVVALVQTCVNKGTEWVLQDQHNAVLRALVMESVRQLDNRHTVTLRVHPDDEAAVADMFAAAREAVPDVDRWIVQGDATVGLGGLIAESPSSTVDNSVALRTALVEGILQHLTLPEGEAEVLAAQAIHEVLREQVAHIESLAPPVPEHYLPDTEQGRAQEAAQEAEQQPEQEAIPEDMPASAPLTDMPHPMTDEALAMTDTPNMADMQSLSPVLPDMVDVSAAIPDMADISDLPDLPDTANMTDSDVMPQLADLPGTHAVSAPADFDATEQAAPHGPTDASVQTPAPVQAPSPVPAMAPPSSVSPASPATPAPRAAQAPPSLAELEEELLPLPEENSDAVNAVLAGGGFLSDDDSVGRRS